MDGSRREKYLTTLGIDRGLLPRRLTWVERLKIGSQFLFELNQKIPRVSLGANYQIYSRFQFRGNGIWTPFTRLERFVVALLATIRGQFAG